MIKYDNDGFDLKGFNKDGFDKNGYKRSTNIFLRFKKYDINGYDKKGYDRGGYDKSGFNRKCIDKDGFDRLGYNLFGFNKEGYNKNGFNASGFNKEGYNTAGYNKEGYNKEGYNKAGYDREGYNKNGFNASGFNKEGYNTAGYNKEGYNKEGYNKAGYDREGYNKNGFLANGIPWWSLKLRDEKVKIFGNKKLTYLVSNIKSSTIFNNPFYILGLKVSASNKEISKRSSDLIKLIEIGNEPSFADDLFPIYKGARETKSIKDATLSLTNESLKVVHSFLWINIYDKELLDLTKDKKPYLVLYNLLNKKTQTSLEKHVLGVYSLIIGTAIGDDYLMNYSINLLKEVLVKNDYLDEFKVKYQQMSELKISDQVFVNLRDKIIRTLGDSYFEFASQYKKWNIYNTYYDNFLVHSEIFTRNIVLPTIEKINKISDKIDSKVMKYKSNDISTESINKINNWKNEFQEQLEIINTHKIEKETNIVSSIDNIAQSFSQLAIGILNTIDRDDDSKGYQFSKTLLDYALKYASSVRIKDDINRNKKAIANGERKKEEIEKAISDIKYYSSIGDSNEVVKIGNKLLKDANNSSEFQMIRKFIINQVIEAMYANLKSAMESRSWSRATNIIDELLSLDELSYSDKATLRDLKNKIMYRGFY